MNILALIGSSRKKGNTARIVQMIETHMKTLAAQQNEPLAFETLFLADMDLRPCRGCRTCFDRGEDHCPLKDDVPVIRTKMDAADGVIFATPVYVDDVSGLMKTLLDRLAYLCHRPALSGKCAFPLATVADSPTGHTLRTLNAALLTWGFHRVGQAGYKLGALASAEEMSRHQPAAATVADKLFYAVSQQHARNPAFVSLLTFKVQQLSWQRESSDSYDYAYWKTQGWLDPTCTFYFPPRSSRMKVTLARLAGALAARLFT